MHPFKGVFRILQTSVAMMTVQDSVVPAFFPSI